MLELHRMAKFLESDEESFAELLAQKTDKKLLREKKHDEAEPKESLSITALSGTWKYPKYLTDRILLPTPEKASRPSI